MRMNTPADAELLHAALRRVHCNQNSFKNCLRAIEEQQFKSMKLSSYETRKGSTLTAIVAAASVACIGLAQQAHAGVTWLVSESDGDLLVKTDGGSLRVAPAQGSAYNPNATYGLIRANSNQVMVNTSTGGAKRWYQDLGSGAISGNKPWVFGIRGNATSYSGDSFMFSNGDLYWATHLGNGPGEITPNSTLRFEGLDIATAFGQNLDCGPVLLWTHGTTGDTISIGLAPNFAQPKDSVSFRNGAVDPFSNTNIYEGAEDTMILQNNDAAGQRNQNYGARAEFFVGEASAANGFWPRRSLIRYDLSSLAGEYEKICRVTLRLKVSDVTGDKDGILRVHRLADANAGWAEGTQTGAGIGDPPDIGETTFNYRIEDSQEWAGSPGAGTPRRGLPRNSSRQPGDRQHHQRLSRSRSRPCGDRHTD